MRDSLEHGGDSSRGGFGVDFAKISVFVSLASDLFPFNFDVMF